MGVKATDTITEMTWIVMPGHCNALNTVFGGQVMSWIDVCAAIAAQRFCRSNVVTASMDQLHFTGPIYHGQIAVVKAMVNWTGTTSMEVGVRVESEDPYTGERKRTSTAYLTFVALDKEGNKTKVPELVRETDLQRQRYREAQQRREDRLASRKRILAARAS